MSVRLALQAGFYRFFPATNIIKNTHNKIRPCVKTCVLVGGGGCTHDRSRLGRLLPVGVVPWRFLLEDGRRCPLRELMWVS